MSANVAVPNCSGISPPRLRAPAGACDAHIHILDARFSTMDGAVALPGATAADYALLQKRLGVSRTVVVQPKVYGTNNDCTLDAIARLGDGAHGIATARGVAVVHPTVSDTELKRLDAGGIRGLRFSVWNPTDTVTTVEMIEPLAKRVADLGWHLQLHMSADQLVAHAALIEKL